MGRRMPKMEDPGHRALGWLYNFESSNCSDGWEVEVIEQLLKYINLDYVTSPSVVMVLVDASVERDEKRRPPEDNTTTRGPVVARHVIPKTDNAGHAAYAAGRSRTCFGLTQFLAARAQCSGARFRIATFFIPFPPDLSFPRLTHLGNLRQRVSHACSLSLTASTYISTPPSQNI